MTQTTSNLQLPTSHLRIGFDAKRAFNNGTGLGNYSRFVINSLVKYFPENEYFLFTPTIKPEFENAITSSSNIKIISPDSLLGKTFPTLWRSYAIAEMCNELKLDVFHGLSNELPVGIEKFSGKKIVTIHDLIFLRYPDYYNNIDRYIYTKKFRHACESSDLVLATSHQTKNDVVEFFKTDEQKIEVTYQNCDESFSLVVDENLKSDIQKKYNLPERFILSVGTIEQRKNQLTILKAFHRLSSKNLKLVFVGRQTEYVKQLTDFLAKNNLEGRVIFLQQVEHADMPAIFQLAKIFIYASEFEGFGIPLLEALRSGVPVLASNSSSLPEVGGDAAQYFEPGNTNELSEQMRLILNDETKYQSMIENGKVQAEKFNSDLLMNQLGKFYRI
ncbi:MAG: glycosyltransferase family 1 protein [Bacteroidota bacterium]